MSTDLAIAVISGVCAIVGILISFIMNGIAHSLRELNRNVTTLNVKMGTVVVRVNAHEKRLGHLEIAREEG